MEELNDGVAFMLIMDTFNIRFEETRSCLFILASPKCHDQILLGHSPPFFSVEVSDINAY